MICNYNLFNILFRVFLNVYALPNSSLLLNFSLLVCLSVNVMNNKKDQFLSLASLK